MEMTIRSESREYRSQPDRTGDRGTPSLPAVASVGRTLVVNVKFAIPSFTLFGVQYTETEIRRLLMLNLLLLVFQCFLLKLGLYDVEAGHLLKCGGIRGW